MVEGLHILSDASGTIWVDSTGLTAEEEQAETGIIRPCSGFSQWYLQYHWNANGTIGITTGTNGITNGTIGIALNDLGIPLVPLVEP